MKRNKGRFFDQAVMMSVAVHLLTAGPAKAGGENNVHLYGALVAEPCVIAPGDDDIPLDFGSVIDKYLYLNTRTQGQAFEIHLDECDLTLGNTVSVTFTGTESSALPGLLVVDSGDRTKGIAIGLETLESKKLPLNKARVNYKIQAGSTVIALRAYVQGEPKAISEKTIERGPFSAIATFTLAYD